MDTSLRFAGRMGRELLGIAMCEQDGAKKGFGWRFLRSYPGAMVSLRPRDLATA
jgi:hypothetical protein